MRALRVLLAWLIFGVLARSGAAEPVGPLLTRVADVRRLSREDAAKGLPFKITGVSIWEWYGDLVFSDGDESIWVGAQLARKSGILTEEWKESDISRGAELEMTGVTGPGDYGPVLLPATMRRIGTRELPKPRHAPIERLIAGSEDAQWIEFEGVVQEVQPDWPGVVRLTMMGEGQLCRVRGVHCSLEVAERWVDARVRLRGIFSSDINLRSQTVGLKMIVRGPEDVEVLSPAPDDPFSAPRLELSALMHFSPDVDPYRRKVTEGTVIFAVPGSFLILQDGQTGVRVATRSREVAVGQRVEVAGFLDRRLMFAGLSNATIRAIGTAPVPVPEPASARRLLNTENRSSSQKPVASDLNARAVSIAGVLRRVDWAQPGVPETAWVETTGQQFAARFPLGQALDPAIARRWVPGAEVSLAGICELEFRDEPNERSEFLPVGFHLWLAAPDALRIVKLPPWWTPQRLALALGSVGAAAALLLVWTWLLRRQVERQTRIIGEKGRVEAAHAERTRIARDLHDEIGANLTHISILSTLAAGDSTGQLVSRQHSSEAALVARQTIQAFDEILWSVNPKNDTLQSLSHYICRATEETLAHSGVSHHFELDEVFPQVPLPPHCRHGLLLAVKEVLHNIVKHAAASRVTVKCTVQDGDIFAVNVSDDGRGFSPEAAPVDAHARRGQGLENIRRRLAEIGGECRIESRPGHGTAITFHLPLCTLKAMP